MIPVHPQQSMSIQKYMSSTLTKDFCAAPHHKGSIRVQLIFSTAKNSSAFEKLIMPMTTNVTCPSWSLYYRFLLIRDQTIRKIRVRIQHLLVMQQSVLIVIICKLGLCSSFGGIICSQNCVSYCNVSPRAINRV